MTLADASARERALDPLSSYCVSAPAGSGKTALLVKRFLRLLGRVADPERVVAITFTRKAAAEMRARVVTALQRAQDAAEAENEHEAALLELARAVCSRDAERGWGLLANPSRLRIQTIDSFCGHLTRQMPVLSGCGGQVTATDRAGDLYAEAISRFLHRELSSSDPQRRDDLSTLLLHLDNNWDTATELLAGLLQRREQWQPVFGGAGLGESERQGLREITEVLVRYRLQLLRQQLGGLIAELSGLLHYRAAQLDENPLFDPNSDQLTCWKPLARLLLTASGDWRKSVNKNDGFPSGDAPAKARKAQMLDLLEELREADDPAMLNSVQQLTLLPDVREEPEHWVVLAALTRLLPRLGAELLLVFQQRGEVDHAQIAMAALTALGEDRAPTDIALRLDYVIEHLLVDEFQDTSSVQFELIRRLTRGWHEHNVSNPEAPRTLLLVGDAMQSIYGFREANVGLFIKARAEGIGDLPLTALDLEVNFRSRESLVQWCNTHFSAGFPDVDDAQLGAVSHRPAIAARDRGVDPELALFTGEGAERAEIEALCTRLREGVADDNVRSIAILGRSRNQLRPVLAALREKGIEVAARDLDGLAQRPVIRDLCTLCTVLADHYDRFAWLSLLRCPAIALDNADLLCVARTAPIAADPLDPLSAASLDLQSLSQTGRTRLAHAVSVLRWAEHYRDRLALRVWVEECWLRLQGAAVLRSEAEMSDAEQFFQCLETLEENRKPFNATVLTEAIRDLFAAPGNERCKVEVMTLHKAKGLEFDWVFIPALAKTTASRDRELLLWDEFTLPGQPPAFLLDIRSGLDADEEPRLYDYLKAQSRQKQRYESTRLFYVGCTRAVDYLWLGASLTWDDKQAAPKSPSSGSLLSAIWPSLAPCADVTRVEETAPVDETKGAGGYRRLRALATLPSPPEDAAARMETLQDSRLAKAFGTAVHRCLESLVYRPQLPASCDEKLRALLRVALLESGADSQSLAAQMQSGEAALDRVLSDAWARWMLDEKRSERAAELPLTLACSTGTKALVLDYVFVDEQQNERWVVDYKTAAPGAGETEAAFIAKQLEHYGEQLTSYVDALRLQYPEPVRCALYFTALGCHAELPQN
jgi:ATP-dependent exoDNAse (exonuclease V) beta subunit